MANTGLIHPGDILQRPNQVVHVVLATGSTNAQAFDTPAGARYVNINFNSDVWVTYGSTAAAIPSTTSTAATTSNAEFNPSVRNIVSTASCTGISLAAEVATKGSLAWYS